MNHFKKLFHDFIEIEMNVIGKIKSKISKIHFLAWIFLAMALGVVAGVVAPSFSVQYLGLLSSAVFLPMIKACIVPLVFSTLVVGLAGHGDDAGRVGRLAWKAMSFFIFLTFMALAIGLTTANIFNSGRDVSLVGVGEAPKKADSHISLKDELNKIFQPSFFQAAVGFNANGQPANSGGEVLAIVVMAVIFSIAIIKLKNKTAKLTMLAFNQSLSEIMFSVVNVVMLFVPSAIFGAMAQTVGQSGLAVLLTLGKLVGSLYVGLFVFMIIVLLPVALIAKIDVRKFMKAVTEPMTIAFATTSSDAALPLAFRNMEAFGVPQHVVSFVLPTSYTFNLAGTTLYLAIASVFAAQASGIELPMGQQIFMMLILMLTSKGVAGVPRASLVVLAATIDQFGLNPAAITVLLGVDQVLDMARAALNVLGSCLSCAIVARWEGVLPQQFDITKIELADVLDESVMEKKEPHP